MREDLLFSAQAMSKVFLVANWNVLHFSSTYLGDFPISFSAVSCISIAIYLSVYSCLGCGRKAFFLQAILSSQKRLFDWCPLTFSWLCVCSDLLNSLQIFFYAMVSQATCFSFEFPPMLCYLLTSLVRCSWWVVSFGQHSVCYVTSFPKQLQWICPWWSLSCVSQIAYATALRSAWNHP